MEPLAIARSEPAVTGGSKRAARNEQKVKAMETLTGEESIRWGELKRKHFPPRPYLPNLTFTIRWTCSEVLRTRQATGVNL
jgi:hypothetical protein